MKDNAIATDYNAVPHDPVMAAADPAMFSPMTGDENRVLSTHLTSGWYKQDAVYPALSESWRETSRMLEDLTAAWWAGRDAEHGEPEAGA